MGEITVEVLRRGTDDTARAISKLLPQLSSSAPEFTTAQLTELLGDDHITLFVARADDDIVGMLTLVTYVIPTGKRARIEDVVVDESARGRGVAFALTEAAITTSRESGARTLDLTSRPDRESANRLYQRAGFNPRNSVTYRQVLH
ncbi:GNAT family N-acetyltransferase [Nocardia sp. AG03]|uniref:GNAT family N-acetyltransferase n=1 Tax=Nocardia sp. AG03 TaxID=3025312 RepID=UPI0024186018|nr:GNAT family N-acetyltransferase [Nocardia sp. AG03]